MPNLGWPELAVIFVLALVFIGPKRLPGVARQAGKAMRELKKASSDFKDQVREGLGMDDDTPGFPYAQPKAGAAIPPATQPGQQALGDAPWGEPEPPPPLPGPLGDAPWTESA